MRKPKAFSLQRSTFAGLVFFVLVLALAAVAQACPGCKNALEDPSSIKVAKSMNASIFYMLGTVFTLIGSLIFYVVREARKNPYNLPPVGEGKDGAA